MPDVILQLLKGDKVDSRVEYADALAENMTGVVRPILGIQGYMLQQPGITSFATASGNDRGGIWNERIGAHYRVSGTKFVEIGSDGTVTELGNVLGNDTVALPYSFNTQAIIANGRYYLYDTTNGFREIIDPDLGNPTDAVWVDGYYVFTDGENLYHTEISDEASIDPLQFATSEYSPDPTIGLGLTTDNKVIAFNRYTIEYFQNNANTEFAFSRIPSRAVRYGLVAANLKCEIGGQWYFVGGPKEGSLSIYRLGVGQAVEIASREVTERLGVYTEAELSEQVMESRIIDGYPAIIVHLPNETLYFNIKVAESAGIDQAWSLLTSSGRTQWRAVNGIYDPNIGGWLYGDKNTSNIGKIDYSIATQYGAKVECRLYTPFVYLETASIDELDIDTIPGFNSVDDASVFISLTYDGVIYSAEQPVSYGTPGAYGERMIMYRMGYVDNMFGLRMRWVSTSRMCYSRAVLSYG